MYEEAFEALRSSDYVRAADLLERAARENGYLSDAINHAFTLACHRSGQTGRLSRFAFKLGRRLAVRDEASAMDYFQRALVSGLGPEDTRAIGGVVENWATPDETPPPVSAPVRRVAHIAGCLLPGHAPTIYLQSLTSSLERQGIRSAVFTTEWAASWFINPTPSPQSEPVEIDADVHVASTGGNFLDRARRVAGAVRASGCDVAFYHASLSEQITARVAAFRPTPIQINVNHGTEMDADLFQGRIHLFRNALERTRFGHRPSRWIPLASDIDARLRTEPPVARRAFGDAATVSATFGNLYKVSGAEYLDALSEILARAPGHVHVFAGSGDPRAARNVLRKRGVLGQVRFFGHQADVAGFLPSIDLYIASFPHSGGHSLIEAMGASRPVVVLGYPKNSHYNSGAELVGFDELIAADPASFVAIAVRLIADRRYREEIGRSVRARFEAEFAPELLGKRYRAFLEELGLILPPGPGGPVDPPGPGGPADEDSGPR